MLLTFRELKVTHEVVVSVGNLSVGLLAFSHEEDSDRCSILAFLLLVARRMPLRLSTVEFVSAGCSAG